MYYWAPAFAVYAGLLCLALGPVFCSVEKKRWWNGALLYSAMLCLAMFAFKWPFISLWEMNPDESQIVASAITLRHDPLFWRSVDAGSHGPLVEYSLVLPSLLGLSIDYGLARAVGLAFFMASAVLSYLAMRSFFSDKTSRIALLPPFTFLVMTNYWDYLSFNAEIPIIFMLSLGVWLASRLNGPGRRRPYAHMLALGIVLGAIPYAKLQGIPLAGAAALWGVAEVWFVWGRSRKTLSLWTTLAVSGLIPSLGICVYLATTGLFYEFYMRFIVQNFFYVTSIPVSLIEKVVLFYTKKTIFGESSYRYFTWIQVLLAALLLASAGVAWRRRRLAAQPSEGRLTQERLPWRIALAGLYFLASVYAIITPGYFFAHYYQLLLFSLAALQCGLLCYLSLALPRVLLQRAALLTFLAAGLFFQLTHEPAYVTRGNLFPYPYSCQGMKGHMSANSIREMALPGDTLAVWGWANHLHVSSGLPVATRTTAMHVFGLPALNKYYVDAYLDELKTARPPFFVDAVAPGMFHFEDRFLYGFERIPQLDAYIKANYALIDSIADTHIYVSKERLRRLRAPISDLGAFLGGEIESWRRQWGDGVFYVDPRLLAADAVAPYTDAAIFPPSGESLADARVAKAVREINAALDTGQSKTLVAALQGGETRIDYLLTKAPLNDASLNDASAGEVRLMRTIHDMYLFKIQ